MSAHDDHPPPDLHLVTPEPPPPATLNPPAEQAVLGALLADPTLVESLAAHLDSRDFYHANHGLIWDAIHAVAAAGSTPDPVTVGTHLLRAGDLTRVGGAAYLADLMAACPIPAQATTYAAQVRDAARLRAIDDTATRLRQAARTADPTNVDRVLERALETLDDAATRFGPAASTAATGLRDLGWIADGRYPEIPPPRWGRRTDGHALFYAGRVNGIYGDPEAAKTWLAQMACVEALREHHLVAIIDVDHNGEQLTVARMLLLGATPSQLQDPDRFRYYEPDDAGELRAAVADLTPRRPAIVVLDSIGEMLPMLGVKSVDNDEITAALRTVATPPALAGACVITVDHLPKSADARATGYAIGGTAKKRAIGGAYIYAETKVPPAPGDVGRVMLRIEKDRLGELRKTCTGKYIGDFVLDSTREHITSATVGPSGALTDEGVFRPTHLMETVSRLIEDAPGITGKTIEKTVRGKAAHIRVAIQRLLEDAYITTEPGPRNATRHNSLKPYREADDDPN